MLGFQLLMEPRDVIYQYDGSLAGLYTCIHACVYGRELPFAIRGPEEAQMSLLPMRRMETDIAKALRVREAIAVKISKRALELCEHVFLSCLEKKEMAILEFLRVGFLLGAQTPYRLTDPAVDLLLQAEKHLLGEAHLFLGFVRFADYEGKLMAAIRPKNYVLPLIAPHFADRFASESFLIYDQTHQVALVHDKGRTELGTLEGEWPEASETEQFYRELWKQFYRTISIQARENPKVRMSHMPKRYWENMVEMQPKGKGKQRKGLGVLGAHKYIG